MFVVEMPKSVLCRSHSLKFDRYLIDSHRDLTCSVIPLNPCQHRSLLLLGHFSSILIIITVLRTIGATPPEIHRDLTRKNMIKSPLNLS